MTSRRRFIELSVAGAGAALLTRCATVGQSAAADPWSAVPGILARIKAPGFPARSFDITKYGAVGDGKVDCSDAFKRAIGDCVAAGGGSVIVPSGRFLTGPIHLRSNVNLHVMKGGTIAFHRDPAKYLPQVFTRWEGVELMNYSPFIYAFEQENIAITGEGTLDGQADCEHWWPWKGFSGDYRSVNALDAVMEKQCGVNPKSPQIPARTRMFEMAEKGVPVSQRVFGEGDMLRPQFIQPYRCRNVLIEGVRIINSPMWEVHPVLCRNVTVRNVRIDSHGPNNDGCNPESCQDVLIDGCEFDTGDDCIAIKSGRNADGRRLNVPTENVIIRNCRMKDGHGGVTIGSEISGGVRNVYAYDCVMDSPNLDRALRFKNNAMRGGVLENIFMRDVQIGEVADSVLSIDFTYEEGAKGSFQPVVRNVRLKNVSSRKSKYGWYLRGIPNSVISDITLEHCSFDGVASGNVAEHVSGLNLRDVKVNGSEVWK
ncbi:MAG TPA: glycoside hydrolase family 28 protein [Longimicrobiales bacterium]|nr:glycoside hydrolase family 28 protein [Longimicrobiales bacterium]